MPGPMSSLTSCILPITGVAIATAASVDGIPLMVRCAESGVNVMQPETITANAKPAIARPNLSIVCTAPILPIRPKLSHHFDACGIKRPKS